MPERDGGFAFGGRERERHVGKEVMEQIFCEPIAVDPDARLGVSVGHVWLLFVLFQLVRGARRRRNRDKKATLEGVAHEWIRWKQTVPLFAKTGTK